MYPLHCVQTGPLLQTCCAPKRYTAGHWSLTRPGVFYIGREDGYVDIWDLLEKTHEPAQSQNICITMITYIKPWTFSSMFILIHGATCLEKLGMLGCSPEKALPPPGFSSNWSCLLIPMLPFVSPTTLPSFSPSLLLDSGSPKVFLAILDSSAVISQTQVRPRPILNQRWEASAGLGRVRGSGPKALLLFGYFFPGILSRVSLSAF